MNSAPAHLIYSQLKSTCGEGEKNWIRIEFGTELSSTIKSQISMLAENHGLPVMQTCLKILQ